MWCVNLLRCLSLGSVTLAGLFQSTCTGANSSQSATVATDSQSQVPAAYYTEADGLKSRELKKALGQIVRQHTVFGYGELWYRYEKTDVVPGTTDQVFDYYSPIVHHFTGTGAAPSGMNKEHACPQSWWGSGAASNAYSDLFNVMPSEVDANNAKSNYPLGLVGSAIYTNARMKVGASSRSEYSGNVFEPCDEFKGDFARLYFYVATCYADAAWGCKESVANTVAFTQEDYPTIKPWLLDLLLRWNADDPVSEWEVIRNERVFVEQGNRNPYIDYPQLADYVWGDSTQYAFDFAHAIVNGTGSGQGAGFTPGDDDIDNTGGNDNPDPADDPDDEPSAAQYGIGQMLLFDSFSSVQQGNDTENSGSANQWAGDQDFPVVESAFEAGHAIKVGSSKKVGAITSRSLENAAGAKLLVILRVKGWTTVEGNLLVGVTGQEPQTASYEATMQDPYQTLRLEFSDVQANAQLRIETSAKRAFITSVRVGTPASDAALSQLRSDQPSGTSVHNLLGQSTSGTCRGFQVRQHQLTFVK